LDYLADATTVPAISRLYNGGFDATIQPANQNKNVSILKSFDRITAK